MTPLADKGSMIRTLARALHLEARGGGNKWALTDGAHIILTGAGADQTLALLVGMAAERLNAQEPALVPAPETRPKKRKT